MKAASAPAPGVQIGERKAIPYTYTSSKPPHKASGTVPRCRSNGCSQRYANRRDPYTQAEPRRLPTRAPWNLSDYSDGRFGSPNSQQPASDSNERGTISGASVTPSSMPSHCARLPRILYNPGNHLWPKNLYNRALAPTCDELKLPRVSWNSFRHASATLTGELDLRCGKPPWSDHCFVAITWRWQNSRRPSSPNSTPMPDVL
jgi:hypothetical protein